MKLAILDDWFNTLRGLTCFSKLNGIEVTVFTDHETDISKLAKRLRSFDALVLFRAYGDYSRIKDQLPNLKLICNAVLIRMWMSRLVRETVYCCVLICILVRPLLLQQNIHGR